ncbi:hypothetical protein V5O48_011079 [Marasmius crinis-equi]|uniref:Uncharacterized protein n=1 Tax=Marasmius crinis-equi TaxID=585013 RepID=A0ABR3F6M6_9AGAR
MRENNRLMGQGILWGGTLEFAAVKERLSSQVSHTLEDLISTFHMLQMEQSENAGLVAHLYLQLPAKDKEDPRAQLHRSLQEFIRYDSEQLVGTGVPLPSFVDKAFKHKLVIRNWPDQQMAIPGVNKWTINKFGTRALEALCKPRIEFVKKTAENTLQDNDVCHKHLCVELWDEDDIKASFMSQRNVAVVTDVDGEVLVKAESTASWRAELLALDGGEEMGEEEEEEEENDRKEASNVLVGGQKGKEVEATAKTALPLWQDDGDEAEPVTSPAAPPQTHIPSTPRPRTTTQEQLPAAPPSLQPPPVLPPRHVPSTTIPHPS